ncbi:beta-1,3-galactosyltransferase 1-like isoform 1-T1 [Synchiropus picturatus]
MPTCGYSSFGECYGQRNSETQTQTRRICNCTWRRSVFLLLLCTVTLFYYYTNITPNWRTIWWKQYNATNVWSSSHSPKIVYPKPAMALKSLAKNVSTVTEPAIFKNAGEKLETSSVVTLSLTRPPTQMVNRPVQTPEPKPAPYVSPGPYVVEYPYEYHYVINEAKACEEKKPFLLLMVPVAPSNRAHRDIIRQTWGKETEVMGKVVKLFFVLGLQSGQPRPELQEQILKESQQYHDLIQSNFLDCYKNLTIKTMVMLKWMDSYCSAASYAMKIDSDVFLNLENLIKMLSNAPKTNYLSGLVARGAQVLRNPKSKWYLPVSLFPNPVYPRYALGFAYVLSVDLAKKLLEASYHVKALYIEDVYLGLCMQYLKIPPTDPPNWGYFHVFPVRYSRCAYSKIVATTLYTTTDRVWLWNNFKQPGPLC